MKEEDIDKRIERVIESVGSKKAAMRQWEAERVAKEMGRKLAAKRWRTYGISAAASIAVIFGIGLGFRAYRSGDDGHFLYQGGDDDYGVASSEGVEPWPSDDFDLLADVDYDLDDEWDEGVGRVLDPKYRASGHTELDGSRDISEIRAMIDSANYEEALQAIEATMADTVIDPTYDAERKDYLRSFYAYLDYELAWLKIDALVKNNQIDDAISLLKAYSAREGEHQAEAKSLLDKLAQ